MNHKRKKINRIKVIISAGVALLLVLIALFASVIAPNDPYATSASAIRSAPSGEFLFGTDNLGRCVFSRVLYGARTTIAATFILVAISFILGSIIGILSGYYGGILDEIMMRIADIMLAFPQMVVAIAVAGILGGGLSSAMIALGITMWTGFARLARSHTFAIKNCPYVQAAKLAGKFKSGYNDGPHTSQYNSTTSYKCPYTDRNHHDRYLGPVFFGAWSCATHC